MENHTEDHRSSSMCLLRGSEDVVADSLERAISHVREEGIATCANHNIYHNLLIFRAVVARSWSRYAPRGGDLRFT